jgi:hypothetical protein
LYLHLVREPETGRTAFAKGKLERLVGKRNRTE